MINKIIKKPYYYVPPCPFCNSRITGHFVKKHKLEGGWETRESLRNGEIATEVYEIPEANCYCLECGFTWPYRVKMEWFSLERIREEKLARCTGELLDEEYSMLQSNNGKKKFRFIRNFIGKV